MTAREKYYLDVQTRFSSGNKKTILTTLHEIRQKGHANILPLVVSLLNKHQHDEVREEVISILGQLKDKEAVPFIIEQIKSSGTDTFKSELIMTCWQSGLDYSEHIDVFTQSFIDGDFQTAIEAFSVIDEWIDQAGSEKIKQCKELLAENLPKVSPEKKAFYLELIKLIESFL
ncbi:MAG: HEAT repeat domain-containing protein [Bacteroidota bacterium]|nr:MAG: HEAT repeat domain-containing protein [Bacteroidota bacterium]